MKQWLLILSILAAALMPTMASADGYGWAIAQPPKKEFLVSGVLKKDSGEITIRLFHSLEVARSEDEALGSFTRTVLDNYPGYSVLTTLVTPVSKQSCPQSI
jgi:hypothetical protein